MTQIRSLPGLRRAAGMRLKAALDPPRLPIPAGRHVPAYSLVEDVCSRCQPRLGVSLLIGGRDHSCSDRERRDSRLKKGRAPRRLLCALTEVACLCSDRFCSILAGIVFCLIRKGAFRCRSSKIVAPSSLVCRRPAVRRYSTFTRPMPQRSHPRKRPPSVWGNGKLYCWASVFLAGELMRADGITDVR